MLYRINRRREIMTEHVVYIFENKDNTFTVRLRGFSESFPIDKDKLEGLRSMLSGNENI